VRFPPSVIAATCFVLAASTPQLRVPANLEPPRSPAALSLAATEPPVTVVMTGDPAPDVAWDGPATRPQRLRDLRAQGHVLLVISPTDVQLKALERERDRLLDLRVVPAAVLDRNAGGVAALALRLGLHFTLIPDPRGVIAAQFNSLDPATHRAAPAWFVVDRGGRVRGLDRSRVPDDGYARLVSTALVLPSPGISLPTSTR
jgi:peroxiredoxin